MFDPYFFFTFTRLKTMGESAKVPLGYYHNKSNGPFFFVRLWPKFQHLVGFSRRHFANATDMLLLIPYPDPYPLTKGHLVITQYPYTHITSLVSFSTNFANVSRSTHAAHQRGGTPVPPTVPMAPPFTPCTPRHLLCNIFIWLFFFN